MRSVQRRTLAPLMSNDSSHSKLVYIEHFLYVCYNKYPALQCFHFPVPQFGAAIAKLSLPYRKMDFINAQIVELKRLWKNKRQLTHQLFSLVLVVFSALMIWQSLIAYTKSESPVVVVLSGSMEPAFQRGDILFLSNTV